MNDFAASNGMRVDTHPPTGYVVYRPGTASPVHLNHERMQALREYFQTETDDRLGRWRSTEHPEYYVIASDQFRDNRPGSWVRIIHETTSFYREATHSTPTENLDSKWPDMRFGAVASEFFAAHPAPKPWHNAQPGEVWLLEANEFTGLHVVEKSDAFVGGVGFTSITQNRRGPGLNAPVIQDARRIWPETQAPTTESEQPA